MGCRRVCCVLIWLCLVVLVSTASETEIGRLQTEFNERRVQADEPGARDVLRRMAALDAEHPKLYISAATMYAAVEQHEDALALMESLGSGGPGLTFGQGVLSYFRKDYTASLQSLTEALQRYRDLGHAAGQAACHNWLGLTLRKQSRLDEAAESFRSALPLLEQLADLLAVSDVASNLGKLEFDRGRPQEALAIQRQALAIRVQQGDLVRQGQSWQEIGRVSLFLDRLDEAIEAYEKALALRRAIGDKTAQRATLHDLGEARATAKDWDRAAADLRQAIALAEELGDEKRRTAAALDLGAVLLQQGRSREAARLLESTATAYRKLGDRGGEARALEKLGYAHLALAEFSRAREVLETSLALARDAGDEQIMADVLSDLASVHISTGGLSQALLHQEQARELYRRAGKKSAELGALNNLAAMYARLGNLEIAERELREVVQLAGQLNDRSVTARARGNLGVVLTQMNDPHALEELLASMELWESLGNRREVAYGQLNTAERLWEVDRREEASRLLDRALTTFAERMDHEGEAAALNLAARFKHEAGRRELALQSFADALALSRRYGIRRQEWIALAGGANVLEDAGRLGQALEQYRRALDVIEASRARLETGELKMVFQASQAELYERAVRLQFRLEPPPAPQAFDLVERAKARSLLDLYAESRAGLRRGLAPEWTARERSLLDELSSAASRLNHAPDDASRSRARHELDSAERRLQRLQVEIHRAAPGLARLTYPRPASLKEIQTHVLAYDELLLSYFVGDERSVLWLVGRNEATVHALPDREALLALVTRFLDRAGRAGVSLSEQAGDSEAESLVEAILPVDLPAGRRLLVAADGPLHHVPFEALRKNGRYLIEDHEIVATSSATFLNLMRELPRGKTARDFLGLAPGDAPTDSCDSLLQIASLFPEDAQVVLTGEACSKENLRRQQLERFRYLHFATHGWLDQDNPRYYGLRLSPSGNGKDEFLYVHEVYSMNLAADLVVLSACQSGLGELVAGEGLIGMTRAFLCAGSRAVLVSLWNVSDRSTAEFMRAFYEELHSGRTVAGALRRTKLAFIASERPTQRQLYRWAPFVLVGDPAR